MKIGIISDTHDNVEGFKKAISIFNEQKVEIVLHCGDWSSLFMLDYCEKLNCNIISAFGNIDRAFSKLASDPGGKVSFEGQCVEKNLAGRSLAIYHGVSKPLLESLIDSGEYDAVFSGHTHIALIREVKNTLHVNPGSAGSPKKNSPSVAVYETKTNNAEIIYF
ncbi:metallophosphoesterase [bacterium]|jgi:uncharacterized protein|nr:metallophosphoesterase [bacterium]MBT4251288.1 metallophosphoesterase [bacterium]MBT4598331.1 metallophosphoesterase [bacterium]MBT6754164.1 metallophosphoesterase [bacterium]MBT7037984.1 metallophosphoesterase [bacterium]